MSKLLDEGNLQFDFSACQAVERFDDKKINPYGMKSVDFVAEDSENLFFLEVKDFQHPKATAERRAADYKMLIDAGIGQKSIFNLEMGKKIKDSLLRKYASGDRINKKVVYLLLINLDKLGEFERGMLKAKITGHIPTGLNDKKFINFTEIFFDLINAKQLKPYGIICTAQKNEKDSD